MDNNTINVYISPFPFNVSENTVCNARRQEISRCKNEKARQSKFYIWQLLRYGIFDLYGWDLNELNVTKTSDGKWQCDKCEFSLSHSENLCAVAIGQKAVGIDLELLDPPRFGQKLRDKILTDKEKKQLSNLSETEKNINANILWTKKEAVFKISGKGKFLPKDIETSNYDYYTKRIKNEEKTFILTIASLGEKNVKIFPLNKTEVIE